jgi:hypothetical protein
MRFIACIWSRSGRSAESRATFVSGVIPWQSTCTIPPRHGGGAIAASKLDAFKPALAELLEKDSQAPAPVLLQRLQTLDYQGGITIL